MLSLEGSAEMRQKDLLAGRYESWMCMNQELCGGTGTAKELADIARNGFGTDITDDDANNHILNVDFLHLIHAQSRIIGFASYDRFEFSKMKVLYLSGIVIRKDNQTRGIATLSLSSAINLIHPDILTMRTQNPIIYHLASLFAKEIYPNCDAVAGPSYELCNLIGEHVAVDRLGMRNYQKDLFFEQGTYGTSLNDKLPNIEDKNTNDLFARLKLEQKRGDSIIIVAKVV